VHFVSPGSKTARWKPSWKRQLANAGQACLSTCSGAAFHTSATPHTQRGNPPARVGAGRRRTRVGWHCVDTAASAPEPSGSGAIRPAAAFSTAALGTICRRPPSGPASTTRQSRTRGATPEALYARPRAGRLWKDACSHLVIAPQTASALQTQAPGLVNESVGITATGQAVSCRPRSPMLS
jgi:hypothetical protein